jgi:hypothetical protein
MRAARWVLLVLAITTTNTANGRPLFRSPAYGGDLRRPASIRSFTGADGLVVHGLHSVGDTEQVCDGPRVGTGLSHLLGAIALPL